MRCIDVLGYPKVWQRITGWCRKSNQAHVARSEEKTSTFSYSAVKLRSHELDSHNDDGSNESKESASNYKTRLIRLLRISPVQEEGLISCLIHVVDLNDSQLPSYEALSYTWGPTTRAEMNRGMTGELKHPILCNGQPLLITENLLNCLQQLHANGYHERDIWIDAICINQDDHDERCQQVSIMADIYRSAVSVIVWLGAADEFTEPACTLMNGLARLQETDLLQIDLQNLETQKNYELLGSANTREHWRSLILLFGRTWFTRAWVVQELVLARKVTILCGSFACKWEDMADVSHYLATRTSANTFRAHLFEGSDGQMLSYKNHPTKLEAVKRDLNGGSGSVFFHSLIRCRTYNASNDHDKVYSLLGLAAPKGRGYPTSLYPNYHLPVAQLYTNVATYVLERVEGLHVLAHAEGDDYKQIPGLPSWVPDWSVRADVGLRITGYERFKAAGDLPCVKEVQAGDRLALLGAQLDVISRVGETKREINSSKTCADWLALLDELENEIPDRDHREAFWRTLVGDTDPHGKVPVREPWENAFYVWINLRPPHLEEGEPSPRDRQLAAAYETAFTHSLNMRLFRTARGHLGLGSTSCREGDLVWIIQGSRVPLVLRPRDWESGMPDYRLVGGAYVHGFMQGEAVDSGLEFGRVTLV